MGGSDTPAEAFGHSRAMGLEGAQAGFFLVAVGLKNAERQLKDEALGRRICSMMSSKTSPTGLVASTLRSMRFSS